MSTDTLTPSRPVTSPLGRILNIVRLHVANPTTIVITPLLILAGIFAVNWVVWWLITTNIAPADRMDAQDGFSYSGASLFIFVYMMVVAVQAMSVTFPFALGYGATRRDFYLGSALTFVGLGAFYTVVYTVLAAIEGATGGWGVGGAMFTAMYFGDGAWWERSFAVFAAFLFFLFVGASAATIWVRWKANGMYAYFIGLAFLLVGAGALITWTQSWGRVGEFFATLGFTGSYAASLVLTAIAGVAGFLVLRRATPRT